MPTTKIDALMSNEEFCAAIRRGTKASKAYRALSNAPAGISSRQVREAARRIKEQPDKANDLMLRALEQSYWKVPGASESKGVVGDAVRKIPGAFRQHVPLYELPKVSLDDFRKMTSGIAAPAVHLPHNPEGDIDLTKDETVELFATDQHFPNVDWGTWELTLRLASRLQPDIVWLNGDYLDWYSVSHWDRAPARKLYLQRDLDQGVEQLRRLREAAPNARIKWKAGNHELWLIRYLNSQAEELTVLRCLELPALMELDQVGAEYVPNDARFRIGDLYHIHGNELKKSGVNIARTMYLAVQTNIIFGHFHRAQRHLERCYDLKSRGAWSIGASCALDCEFMHHTSWQNEIAVVSYGRNGNFGVESMPILHDGATSSLMYRGETFTHEAVTE